jgi:WD40 repeat protein
MSQTWNVGNTILDLYEVTEVLGSGAFGKVYKVRHLGWNVDLAVKVPKAEVIAAAGGVESFAKEAETWVNLGLHPHIVSCYYVRQIENIPTVFAEYLAGGNLHEWIESRRLYTTTSVVFQTPLQRILDVAIQFAWGLHYAHEQGLIHQDVKPLNVMMTPDGGVKVTDFGLARGKFVPIVPDSLMEEGVSAHHSLRATKMSGTPAYCSPEQLRGEQLSRRTDLWSWAVSILEMFNGDCTWRSGTIAATLLENYLESGSEDSSLPQMPEPLAELLRACFQEDPEERPHNMLTVAGELQSAYQQSTGEVYPRLELQAASNSPDSLNNQALSLWDLGKEREAIDIWKRTFQETPDHLEVKYNYLLLSWRGGGINDDVLLSMLKSLRSSHPKDNYLNYLIASVHLERDDCEAVAQVLEEVPQTIRRKDKDIQTLIKAAIERLPESRRLVRRFTGHTNSVISVSLSADGRLVVSGSYDGTVKLWQTATGKCLHTFESEELITSVSLSANGRYVASASEDITIKIWDTDTGECLRILEGIPLIHSVSLSANGQFIFAGDCHGSLHFWDIATGQYLHAFVGDQPVYSVNLSDDGNLAISGCVGEEPKLWDTTTGHYLRTLEGHDSLSSTYSVAFGFGGYVAISGSEDNTLKVWETNTGKCLRTFKGHKNGVISVSLSTDARCALSGSYDCTFKLWDLRTSRCLRTFPLSCCSDQFVSQDCVKLSSDGQFAISVGQQYSLELWKIGVIEHPYTAPLRLSRPMTTEAMLLNSQIYSKAIEEAIQAQGKNPTVVAQHIRRARSLPGYEREREAFDIWIQLYTHLPRQTLIQTWIQTQFSLHYFEYVPRSFSADGRFLLSVRKYEGSFDLWELPAWNHLRTFGYNDESRKSVVNLSPDGQFAISMSWQSPLTLWETSTGEALHTFEGYHHEQVFSASWSVDNQLLLLGSTGGTLDLLETFTGRHLKTLASCLRIWDTSGVDLLPVSSSFSPDSRFVLSTGYWNHDILSNVIAEYRDSYSILRPDHLHAHSSNDLSTKGWYCALILWEVSTGRFLRDFRGHTHWVTSVSWSPNGKIALSGNANGTLELWRVDTARLLRIFKGHTDRVDSVCFSGDGNFALSGSRDNTVKLWEIATGKCVQTFEGHSDRIVSVRFSSDGRFAISASEDSSLIVWVLDWELADRPTQDWDEKARCYLETFLTLHTPYAMDRHPDHHLTEKEISLSLTRQGYATWTEEDFQSLLCTLGCAGYGWLNPKGVQKQLESMTTNHKKLIDSAGKETISFSGKNQRIHTFFYSSMFLSGFFLYLAITVNGFFFLLTALTFVAILIFGSFLN